MLAYNNNNSIGGKETTQLGNETLTNTRICGTQLQNLPQNPFFKALVSLSSSRSRVFAHISESDTFLIFICHRHTYTKLLVLCRIELCITARH